MNLARINNILTATVVAINLFIFCMPFVPAGWLWVRQNVADSTTHMQKKIESGPIPDGHRLVIPSILLDEKIYDGPTESTLSKGLWHQPNDTSPGQPGKTIIAGHRFTYGDPEGAFYHLDKLNVGNDIAIYWEGSKHLYSVTDKYVVGANYQLESSNSEQLMLYTCTPIWNPKDRLIISAQPYPQGDL